MEKLEKGFCFTTADHKDFLVMGDAVSKATGEIVYLCQELTGTHRLMIWTVAEIMKESDKKTTEIITGPMTKSGKTQADINDFGFMQPVRVTDSVVDENNLQQMMIEFLEASFCGRKLELLEAMKGNVTETMLDSMALSMDYEIGGSSVEEKYYSLERFLKTRKRYEGSRLR